MYVQVFRGIKNHYLGLCHTGIFGLLAIDRSTVGCYMPWLIRNKYITDTEKCEALATAQHLVTIGTTRREWVRSVECGCVPIEGRCRTDSLAEERSIFVSRRPLAPAPGVQDVAAEGDGAVHPDAPDGGPLDEVPGGGRALCLHGLRSRGMAYMNMGCSPSTEGSV